MRFALRPNPEWRAASGHDLALAQGAWAGAGAIVLLVFAGFAGDVGFVLAIVLTAGLPGAMAPLAVADIVLSRRATWAWLDAALVVVALALVVTALSSWVLPSGGSFPPALPDDESEIAVPTVAGLLLAAERLAARGRLDWRDRALGAAAGYLVVGGVFLVRVEWLSWAVLLAVLALRLPWSARVTFIALSAAAALGLGQYVSGAGTGPARALEVAAFLLYAAASLGLHRLRPLPPRPVTSVA